MNLLSEVSIYRTYLRCYFCHCTRGFQASSGEIAARFGVPGAFPNSNCVWTIWWVDGRLQGCWSHGVVYCFYLSSLKCMFEDGASKTALRLAWTWASKLRISQDVFGPYIISEVVTLLQIGCDPLTIHRLRCTKDYIPFLWHDKKRLRRLMSNVNWNKKRREKQTKS